MKNSIIKEISNKLVDSVEIKFDKKTGELVREMFLLEKKITDELTYKVFSEFLIYKDKRRIYEKLREHEFLKPA